MWSREDHNAPSPEGASVVDLGAYRTVREEQGTDDRSRAAVRAFMWAVLREELRPRLVDLMETAFPEVLTEALADLRIERALEDSRPVEEPSEREIARAAREAERAAWRAAWPEERVTRETHEARAELERRGFSREPWPCVWLDTDGYARAVGGSVYDAARAAVESYIEACHWSLEQGEQPPDCSLVPSHVLDGRAVGLVGDAGDVEALMRWLRTETPLPRLEEEVTQ